MKNLYKDGDRWRVEFMRKGKRTVRKFKYRTDAVNYLRNLSNFELSAVPEKLGITPSQLEDARNALKLLPEGLTLVECVNYKLARKIASKGIFDALKEWIALKTDVSPKYIEVLSARVGKFAEFAKSFDFITPEKIFEFVRQANAVKTQRHYFNAIKEFLEFSAKKGYLENPFDKITSSEAPRVKRKKIEIPSVDRWREVFNQMEFQAPNLVGLYALVAFGGIRLAEAQRLSISDIDFGRREILLSFEKTKTGDSWLQSNMPENVWIWLAKYPPNKDWRSLRPEKAKKGLNLPRNAFRHSFACYHLSLYRDMQKTAILMRHRSPGTLWQNYLDTLIASDIAEKYFEIAPQVQRR